jgi:hypothetical protein
MMCGFDFFLLENTQSVWFGGCGVTSDFYFSILSLVVMF